jgi:hypothetical protein
MVKRILNIFFISSMLVFLFMDYIYPEKTGHEKKVCSYSVGEYKINTEVLIFADKTVIRKSPAVKSEAIAVLDAGIQLKIISKSLESHVVNGYRENWYEVQAVASGRKKIGGYIWGGLLSKAVIYPDDIRQSKEKPVLLIGITEVKNDFEMKAEARMLVNGRIVSRVAFNPVYLSALPTPDGSYSYSVSGFYYGSKGFEPDIKIFGIEMAYPAGQFPSGEALFFWDGKELKFLLEARLSGYEGEGSGYTVIFPSDKKGLKNQVMVDYRIFSQDGRDRSILEIFKWDGKGFNKVQ